ncbi:putative phosphatase phospho2 [Brachionus plicatilis]|uniref:Putative phosphatase phospho2 n=1 Tax=Brachionus plicatilis TaxID=10195 RepID=A0A3M7RK73_BRAPC|nr:putative phosphatase phospho2 [Brachionus plicatilis]
MASKFAIFDFDATIINDNSDSYINELLIEKHHANRERQGRDHDKLSAVDLRRHILPYSIEELYPVYNWPTRMNAAFRYMAEDLECTTNEILDKLKEIKVNESMKQLISNLVQNDYQLFIVSDANKLFIELILDQNGLLDKFAGRIFSNEGFIAENGLLKIRPFYLDHKEDKLPYNCVYCCEDCGQPSICKREVVKDLLKNVSSRKVVYVGDGRNDFCPALDLKESDYYFVRRGFNLEKYLEDENLLGKIKANIKFWSSGSEILNQIKFG